VERPAATLALALALAAALALALALAVALSQTHPNSVISTGASRRCLCDAQWRDLLFCPATTLSTPFPPQNPPKPNIPNQIKTQKLLRSYYPQLATIEVEQSTKATRRTVRVAFVFNILGLNPMRINILPQNPPRPST
jgi:hypothetical protein